MGILTVAAVMLVAQTATYGAEQTTKEREGTGKISGQDAQKQSGQEMQKQSGQEKQKPSGQDTQRQSGQEMQPGQSGQAGAGNFSEEMQRQNAQIWQAGKQSQSQCQRPDKSQQAAAQQPGTQPGQAGQQAASQQQTGQQPDQQAAQDQGKQTQGQSAAGPTSAQTVKGQFVRMESDFYIIKDQSGKETCIPTSYGTFIDQTFTPGQNIVARIGKDGTATVIGRVSDTQTASAGTQSQGMTSSSEQSSSTSRDRDFAGSQQGSQSQGMPGSSDQPRRDRDVAGSPGSQSQGMGSESIGESSKSSKPQTTASVVKGELLKIQGEFYTVKDSSGKEVRLHVNKETKMDSPVNVGDKIEAERTASDHAVSIKLAQDTGKGSGEGSRTR
jgi:hypothetical protein